LSFLAVDMAEQPPLSDRERADLVAYLDGELKGDAARTIEGRIAHEPAVREEAEALRRAWDMLDFLPLPEPSVQFTHRTLEKVVPITAPVVPLVRPRRWVWTAVAAGWAAAVAVALVGGYEATRRVAPPEPGDQDLVRDLRVIENKRLYEAADDLDFVRELDAPDLFGDDAVGT
jgi:anti-sigma factor RsiW